MRVIILAALVLAAEGLSPGTGSPQHMAVSGSQCQLRMGAPHNIAKKAALVNQLKETLAESSLIFSARSAGLTVNEMNIIRQKMPEGTTIRCVKNTLMRRALQDFPNFQGGASLLENSNFWFFVPETAIRDTVEVWNGFIKAKAKQVSPHSSSTDWPCQPRLFP